MPKIVQIRGTSGSGKTYTARQIMTRLGVEREERNRENQIVWYDLNQGVTLIGKYETACGGCDTIKTQDEIVDRVLTNYSRGRHVVFEGLLISQIYDRYAALAKNMGPQTYAFAYLDTPLDKCIEQVNARRQESHEERLAKAKRRNMPVEKLPTLKDFNEANTRSKHRDCIRNRSKDLAGGITVIDLKHDADPAAQVLAFMGIEA